MQLQVAKAAQQLSLRRKAVKIRAFYNYHRCLEACFSGPGECQVQECVEKLGEFLGWMKRAGKPTSLLLMGEGEIQQLRQASRLLEQLQLRAECIAHRETKK